MARCAWRTTRGERRSSEAAAPLAGAQVTLPDVLSLQQNPATRREWIKYSAKDAVATWLLRQTLEAKLRGMRVQACQFLGRTRDSQTEQTLEDRDDRFKEKGELWQNNMWDFYCRYWRDFGELLTQMEAEGMRADRDSLHTAEQEASAHQRTSERAFRDWVRCRLQAKGISADSADLMNLGSGLQARCAATRCRRRRPRSAPSSHLLLSAACCFVPIRRAAGARCPPAAACSAACAACAALVCRRLVRAAASGRVQGMPARCRRSATCSSPTRRLLRRRQQRQPRHPSRSDRRAIGPPRPRRRRGGS